MSRYSALDAALIVDTIRTLERRIGERFPESGLRRVAAGLLGAAEAARSRTRELERPHIGLRIGIAALGLLFLAGVFVAVSSLRVSTHVATITDLVQTLESGVNDLFFVGVAIWFLTTLEGRRKRHLALQAVHELRSLAHIVDMHQLTKDPELVTRPTPPTASSPARTMRPEELGRYLDYCSELLSLTGKVAAMYVQRHHDPVVLDAVNDVEVLTIGMSRKIWQKISILERE